MKNATFRILFLLNKNSKFGRRVKTFFVIILRVEIFNSKMATFSHESLSLNNDGLNEGFTGNKFCGKIVYGVGSSNQVVTNVYYALYEPFWGAFFVDYASFRYKLMQPKLIQQIFAISVFLWQTKRILQQLKWKIRTPKMD